jgi:ribonuclease P protein component
MKWLIRISSLIPLKDLRLNKPWMYKQVYEKGKVIKSTPLALRFYFPEETDINRVGFIIRKKLGKAHVRNVFRRALRGVFQEAHPQFASDLWMVFEVYPAALTLSLAQFRSQAEQLVSKINFPVKI